jgi:hypothetical protein
MSVRSISSATYGDGYKIVAEQWSAAELEDEIKELVYEHERHMRASRISGARRRLRS